MGEELSPNVWLIRVHYKPLVGWIWYGCLLMALGGALAASDRRYRSAVRAKQPGAVSGAKSLPA